MWTAMGSELAPNSPTCQTAGCLPLTKRWGIRRSRYRSSGYSQPTSQQPWSDNGSRAALDQRVTRGASLHIGRTIESEAGHGQDVRSGRRSPQHQCWCWEQQRQLSRLLQDPETPSAAQGRITSVGGRAILVQETSMVPPSSRLRRVLVPITEPRRRLPLEFQGQALQCARTIVNAD